MDLREILKKVRAIEVKTRKAVQSTFTGNYHSVFKGQGLHFSEVREYSPGDDVRLLDWNVTARMRSPYIKIFHEERELSVILMVDLSGSGYFGSGEVSKLDIITEIAGVLGFSAINNNDKVGLILFSDHVEKVVGLKKGKDHILRLLREIYYYQSQSKQTNISEALRYLVNMQKKKSVVFLISDFLDKNYETMASIVAKKHDLIPILIKDPRETEFPNVGYVGLEDPESGKLLYINSHNPELRDRYKYIMQTRHLEQDRFFSSINVEPIHIDTSQSYLLPLKKYFESRSKRF